MVLVVLALTSLTALTLSASTLGLIELDARTEPDVVSVVTGQPALPAAQLAVSPWAHTPVVRHLAALAVADSSVWPSQSLSLASHVASKAS